MFFVCRWRDESPFSKTVVKLPDATVLDWFRRNWDREGEWLSEELDGVPYGLDSIFRADLPRPGTLDELNELLVKHLYVEGDDLGDFIRLDEHSLRVRTDDDEVDLAYYFLHDDVVATHKDRLAYLVNDVWPLPDDAVSADFTHDVRYRTVSLGLDTPEAVFSVRICWETEDAYRNLDLPGPIVFPGLTLPELADHLVSVADVAHWPHEARLLHELVVSADGSVEAALRHYARLEGYNPAFDGPEHGGWRSLVRFAPHIAQVSRHIDDFFGYDQWFLFDTRWAAAHPDLARSLLRYAAQWDPFATKFTRGSASD